MERLTARQQVVLDFIRDYIRENGSPPTFADIAEGLGFRSINAAVDHVKALVKKNVIELQAGVARGIRLKDEAKQEGLPVIGRVAAGSPILAQEHVEHHYLVDPNLFSMPADYLLRVRGNSMINAGILDGDLIAVHRTQTIREGQIVIARLQDDVTVKRFHRNGEVVELIAENPDYPPIVVDPRRETLDIEGLCVGVIRSMQ
ncbi:repressor LexA [Chitinivorax tropicus]|uniref:LexA repressor n=1 Tax=Chitinivorax tropicus TaxID=714531 RepID=A0A840ML62_9PROT|nr:transcriptional repressor LexA [Chitinivorax tropicus]MBB5016893.1 repressor LexA [Chitinivorax tropicus]